MKRVAWLGPVIVVAALGAAVHAVGPLGFSQRHDVAIGRCQQDRHRIGTDAPRLLPVATVG